MKGMKKFTLVIGLVLIATTLMAQKFGHLNSQVLLQQIPEYDSISQKIEKIGQEYEKELERLQVEINKKIENYNNDTLSSQLIRESNAREIQEMQYRVQQFNQRAQQDLQQKSMQFMQPLMNKIQQAIEAVAEEQGLIYVFDLAQGNPVYQSDQSVDLTPLVLEHMGLEYKPVPEGQAPGAGIEMPQQQQ